METKRRKGLIASYYLSKYDKEALVELNYNSYKAAFRDIGAKLNIPANTIKNRRDDYDSINENHRRGWHQRELSKSILEIAEQFEKFSKEALTEIVKDILSNSNESATLINLLESEKKNNSTYNNRGVTGKQAEKIFIQYFENGFFEEYLGDLIDTREEGCGYDFKLSGESEIVFEVKGLSPANGGITFTDKEWSVAKKLKNKYILIIISEVFLNPKIRVVVNPYEKVKPSKTFSKVITVNWSFQSNQVE
ncbi:DUF3883 domain-containing protein [Rossellomorea sp. AcN35-11]|nr:DUF3883 domain-containing protein [Rossellomorea aquimaris]WJV29868.1 DUF3883 domain-containing protein [Rossellomorea sp. AcN35-11]